MENFNGKFDAFQCEKEKKSIAFDTQFTDEILIRFAQRPCLLIKAAQDGEPMKLVHFVQRAKTVSASNHFLCTLPLNRNGNKEHKAAQRNKKVKEKRAIRVEFALK